MLSQQTRRHLLERVSWFFWTAIEVQAVQQVQKFYREEFGLQLYDLQMRTLILFCMWEEWSEAHYQIHNKTSIKRRQYKSSQCNSKYMSIQSTSIRSNVFIEMGNGTYSVVHHIKIVSMGYDLYLVLPSGSFSRTEESLQWMFSNCTYSNIEIYEASNQ